MQNSYSAGKSYECRQTAVAGPIPAANTRSWCGTIPVGSWADAAGCAVDCRWRCRYCRPCWKRPNCWKNWARLRACGSAGWRWLAVGSHSARTRVCAGTVMSAPTGWCRSSTRRWRSTTPPNLHTTISLLVVFQNESIDCYSSNVRHQCCLSKECFID